jgi:hypothetical protein
MQSKTLYHEGHLFVAAIRVLERCNSAPPTLEQISELIHFSTEQTSLISRRLRDAGIVEQVEGAYGDRWGIADHLKLEELPRDLDVNQLNTALKKFQSERSKLAEKVESIKELQAQKKKDLFAGLEKKLKKDLSEE